MAKEEKSNSKSIEPVLGVDRTKFLKAQAEALEDRLKRSSSSGKNQNNSVSVKLRGGRKVDQVEINAKQFGLNKKQVEEIGQAFQEATNAALEKYSKNVSRSIEKVIRPNKQKNSE